jgi:hypothetical protein
MRQVRGVGEGIILDMSTLQPKRVLLKWRFVPVAVGATDAPSPHPPQQRYGTD